jgi:hypothetical protein
MTSEQVEHQRARVREWCRRDYAMFGRLKRNIRYNNQMNRQDEEVLRGNPQA